MKKLKSCGVLLFREEACRQFLLMEHPDRLDLPKGHVKKGETEVDCALRELEEETGLTAEDIELDTGFRFVTRYEPRYRRFGGKQVQKTVVIFLGWMVGDREIRPTEHRGFRWVDWDPPHGIQPETIDPLLTEVQEHFASGGHLVPVSRFLSFVLRHRPEKIGLAMDGNGWVAVADLIEAAGRHGRHLSRELIVEVVVRNDKQRFGLSEDGSRIRARQGHSRPVDLGLQPLAPPEVLYHGTAQRQIAAILQQGLSPGQRQHVHLSPNVATARGVGRRHGRPAVLAVAAKAMHEAGHVFFLSENGVWLTGPVPAPFLSRLDP